jgi:hypothetical protein
LRLAQINLDSQLQTYNEKIELLDRIKDVFKTISNTEIEIKNKIKRRIGSTATSKILHMAVPDFFIMCDSGIREIHGVTGNGAGYTNFMIRMSIYANYLDKNLDLSKLVNKKTSIPRLIDNYNYILALARLHVY